MVIDAIQKETTTYRQPRLDTILMVEEHIKNHDGEFKKRKLWETLPKKMMYQTFCTIINYLAESRKISADSEGKIGWIYYPEKAQEYLLKTNLIWKRNETPVQSKISGRRNKKSVRRIR